MTTEKTPHKHADILRAIADGTTVQYWSDKWKDRDDDSNAPDPITYYFYEWRIKPEVKPDCSTFYRVDEYYGGLIEPEAERFPSSNMSNLKLTFDGETGKLKSAEVI